MRTTRKVATYFANLPPNIKTIATSLYSKVVSMLPAESNK